MTKQTIVSQRKDRHQSAARLLIILGGSVFIIEMLIMMLLSLLPPISAATEMLIDATLLSTLLFPIFYFLVFRPLILSISERKQAEDALRESETRFRNMADQAPALIWMADTQNLGRTG